VGTRVRNTDAPLRAAVEDRSRRRFGCFEIDRRVSGVTQKLQCRACEPSHYTVVSFGVVSSFIGFVGAIISAIVLGSTRMTSYRAPSIPTNRCIRAT